MHDLNKTIIEPTEHRVEGDLKVCDPTKTDHTQPIDEMRIERMQNELKDGFDLIRKYRLAATFFGSSRLQPSDPTYQAAEKLGALLAQSGFAVVTGGAGGIMEAANKGAHDAGGASIGLNIALPLEQHTNKYLTEQKTFNYFFTRKVMLSYAAEVYIYFPGGFGTLNEFFEIITLIQTRKIKRVPVLLYGREYWTPILEMIKTELLDQYQMIDKEDLDLYSVVDSVDEAYERILKVVKC